MVRGEAPPANNVSESWSRGGRGNAPRQLLDLSGQRGRGDASASYWIDVVARGEQIIPLTISLKKINYEIECF